MGSREQSVVWLNSGPLVQVLFDPTTEAITDDVKNLMKSIIGCVSSFSRLPAILGDHSEKIRKVRELRNESEWYRDKHKI